MIDLHTNVYPRKFGVQEEGSAGKRPRVEGKERAHVQEESMQSATSGGAASDMCEHHGNQDSSLRLVVAFDEELRRFARRRSDCDPHPASFSGRQFAFADLVQDARVLDAARMLCVKSAPVSGATGQGHGSAQTSAPASSAPAPAPPLAGTMLDKKNARMAQEDELFRLRAAITHGILRLRTKGWLVLADELRDAYIYVSCPSCLHLCILPLYLCILPLTAPRAFHLSSLHSCLPVALLQTCSTVCRRVALFADL